jgi:8-oxo-dGTP pyrophosphatase MutT (NUDIX family)
MKPLPHPLSAHVLFPKLRARLHTRDRHIVEPEGAAPSAVMIALFERDADIHMWLLKRPETMSKHRGQVAFPGGKRDPEDETLLDTALREAEEELGIARAHVEPLGVLDDLRTGTGFVITPHVMSIRPDFVPTPSPREVARVITAPLRVFTGKAFGVFPRIGHMVEGELVWGATFAIARALAEHASEAL